MTRAHYLKVPAFSSAKTLLLPAELPRRDDNEFYRRKMARPQLELLADETLVLLFSAQRRRSTPPGNISAIFVMMQIEMPVYLSEASIHRKLKISSSSVVYFEF